MSLDFSSEISICDSMEEFTRRIVILGKTGAGKSSLANTLFGEPVFAIDSSPESGTKKCQAKSKRVHGKKIVFIDTPGFFDTGRSEEEMKPEILRCIAECAPGPHVFLIVLKVEKFTEQEKQIVERFNDYFSEEALRYATVLFTHGDQLPEGQKIEDFVRQSKDLSHLVKKCGGRCNVIDNKHWVNEQQDDYRSNRFQVKKLLSTIDEIIEANKRGYYSTELLQVVKREIDQKYESIKESCSNLPEDEITQEAKTVVIGNLLHEAQGISTRALLKAFLRVATSGSVRVDDPAITLGVALISAIAASAARAVTTKHVEAQASTPPLAAPCAELSDEEQK